MNPLQLALDVINKSRTASLLWGTTDVTTRLQYIRKLRDILSRDLEDYVECLQRETHKVPMDGLTADMMPTLQAIDYYIAHAKRILKPQKAKTPWIYFGGKSYTRYEPFGTVLVISPWNFPVQLALVPALSALIAGNCVVLKPSERLIDIPQRMKQSIDEAGFPEGVFQLVMGDGTLGAALVEAQPNKIFFTGSAKVGRAVAQNAAKHLIPCDLELSGKDPLIVCADANVERAARAAVWGAFMHSGQVCVSVERAYVHKDVYPLFVEQVLRFTKELKQSPTGFSDVGGMTTQDGFQHVKDLVNDAVNRGARRLSGSDLDAQFPIYPPTVLVDVTPEMRMMQEEIFGPILPIIPVSSDEEAISAANDSPYGLNASVFTENMQRGRFIASKLACGCCSINDVIRNIVNMHQPFGGVKKSGMGRYHGVEGLRTFTQSKAVMIQRGRSKKALNWYPYRQNSYRFLMWYLKR